MASGTVEWVMTCRFDLPVGTQPAVAGPANACVDPANPTVRGIFQMKRAYVIDGTAQGYFEDSLQPLDYVACAYLWSFGLSTVVTLYLVSKYVGEIVGFIRTAIR